MKFTNIFIFLIGLLVLASLSFATGVSSCGTLAGGDTYTLTTSISGALDVGFGAFACIKIGGSNVLFDCDGYNVGCEGISASIGIYPSGTIDNITIQNCPSISNCYRGISNENGPPLPATNIVISNSTLANNNVAINIIRGTNLTMTDIHAYNQSVGCFKLGSYSATLLYDNITMTNVLANNCTGVGFNLFASNVHANNLTGIMNSYGLLVGITSYGSSASDPTNISVTNSVFYGATTAALGISGISDIQPINVTLENVSLYSSLTGLYVSNSIDLSFNNASIYSNTQTGASLADANVTQGSLIFYDNALDASISNAVQGFTPTLNMSMCFLPPSGAYQNYTNISLVDTLDVEGEYYSFNWSTNSSILPTDYTSFAQKYISVPTVVGSPSIDTITWNWLESELTGSETYDESAFELWNYTSSWSVLNDTPDTTSNSLTLYSLAPLGLYAILLNDSVDTTYPTISLEYPENITYNTNESLPLNYTVADETEIDTCWYLLDEALLVSMPTCTNTTFNVVAGDGWHNMTIYVNDTTNNTNSSSVYFTIDSTYPTISLEYPENITYNTNESLSLNFTALDTNRDSCWYSLDGAASVALDSCANTTFNVSSGDGWHNVTVYVNDTANNTNSSIQYFSIDSTYPTISIISPTDTTYTSSSVSLNYLIADTNLDSCQYSLNNGVNTSLTGCGNTTLTLTNNDYTLIVYVNDTANNTNSSSVSFTVNSQSTSSNTDNGQNKPLTGSISIHACQDNIIETNGVSGVEVTVVNDDTLELIASGITNSEGRFEFGGCGMNVKITLMKGGYVTYRFVQTLANCDACVEQTCTDDADCAANAHCSNGACVSVQCPSCGIVLNHVCQVYACCFDSDCGDDQTCTNHICVDNTPPQNVECTSDSDCMSGEVCIDQMCVVSDNQPTNDNGQADADAALQEARVAIDSAESLGKDASEAEAKLLLAQKAYATGDYVLAKGLADEARILALNAQSAGAVQTNPTDNQAAKKPQFDWSWLIGIIVVVLIIAGGYFLLKKKAK